MMMMIDTYIQTGTETERQRCTEEKEIHMETERQTETRVGGWEQEKKGRSARGTDWSRRD